MVTITEDYVSLEVAKLLKEKGFNGRCFAYYSIYVDNWKTLKFWKKYAKTYDTIKNNGYVLVPTHQMAMKWLREVHKIGIFPSTYTFTNGDGTEEYHPYGTAIINLVTYELMTDDIIPRCSYEETVEAALKYSLEKMI